MTAGPDAGGGTSFDAAPLGSNPDAAVQQGTPDAAPQQGTPDARDAGGGNPTGTGNVSIVQVVAGNFVTYRTSVSFVNGIGVGGCPYSMVDGCVVFTCPASNDPAAVAGGTVTMSGGKLGAPLTLSPNPTTHTYAASTGNTRAWNPGDSLHFVLAGDGTTGVGPLDETLVAPSDATVTAPALSLQTPLQVSRASALTFSWTSGASPKGLVSVLLTSQASPSDPLGGAICRWPISAGSGSASAAVLGMLSAGSGVINMTAENPKSVVTGSFMVEVNLRSSLGSGQATFD